MAVLPGAVGGGAEGVGLCCHLRSGGGGGALIDGEVVGAAFVHKEAHIGQIVVTGEHGGGELHAPRQRAACAAGEGVGAAAAVGEGVARGGRSGGVVDKDAANHIAIVVGAGCEGAAPEAGVVVAAAVAGGGGVGGGAAQGNP